MPKMHNFAKSAKTPRGAALSRLVAIALAGGASLAAFAGDTYKITAKNGVGDVDALTNAIAQLNKGNTTDAKILLAPGVYNLKGYYTYLNGTVQKAHLYINTAMKNGLIAGTGPSPGDTVLIGGGQEDNKGVFHIWTGDASKPTVVSNLTMTGGYKASDDAGAIYGSDYLIIRDCIVSNNYASGLGAGVLRAKMYNCLIANNRSKSKNGAGFWSNNAGQGADGCIFSNNTTTASGGGFYAEGANGFLLNCKFYDNSANGNGSGAYVSGASSIVSNCTFRGNAPTAGASSSKFGGGLYLSSGECVDCKFFENSADRGGGAYIGAKTVVVRDCQFEGNKQTGWASGAAIFVNASSPLALVSNCVFNANVAAVQSSRTIISNADLVDCTISNHTLTVGYVTAGCNMTRCLFYDNRTQGSDSAQHLDIGTIYGGTVVSRTNVNCVIVNNKSTGSANNAITEGKTIVSCTYADNSVAASAGDIIRNCTAWNALLANNTVAGNATDIKRTSLYLTNCVFTASSVAVDSPNFSRCKLVASARFSETEDGGPYDIRDASPAFGAGVWEDWMADAVGGLDFARRPRVMFGAIDVGALECQYRPGFLLLMR